MPQRKRKFTKCIDKRAKKSVPGNQSDASSNVDLQDSDMAEPPASASADVRTVVLTQGAKRKVNKSVLESNLKRSYRELDKANYTVAHLEQSNDSLSKKNLELTNTVKRNRESIRHTKTVASSTVKHAKGQIKKTEEAAATTMKEARKQVHKLQAEIKKLQESAGEKDLIIMNLKEQHEDEILRRVSDAVEKERVSASMLYLSSYFLPVYNLLNCLCTGTFVKSLICSREEGRIQINWCRKNIFH